MAKIVEMTADEWDLSRAPKKMLPHAQKGKNARKLRLFACACCRTVWDLIPSEVCREGVKVAERFAEGLATEAEREAINRKVDAILDAGDKRDSLKLCVSWALASPTAWNVSFAPEVTSSISRSVVGTKLFRIQADLLRCIFGNPFRTVIFDPAWRTDTAVTLAKGIHENRDFSVLPILADVLQDAGCDDPHLLGHCRAKTSHAQGCWVVDSVLGKA